MLALTALDVLLSGRDLNETYAQLERTAQAAAPLRERGALQVWAQRGVSLLLLVATLQRIGSHVLNGRAAPAPLLSAGFLVFWAASLAAPALLGAQPRVSHEYAYPLLLGLACTLVEPPDHQRILQLLRNALVLFMAAGLPLLLVQPGLVLESTYDQGLLPGLPRYGGLASSPVMMGVLAQTALLVLWARPFQRRWLHRAASLLGLAILVVAQSKTAWLSFLLGGACMWMVQDAGRAPYGLGHPRRTAAAVALCLCVIVAAVAGLVGILVLDLPGRLQDFLSTPEGVQLASLTGRDRIWVVALEEWRNHPVFGYGLPMWDSEYRREVGLPQATHAHNQLIDTLGRAGAVGAVGLAVYASVLVAMSLRHARAGGGLGLAMGVTVALLSVSEVPLLLIDYGSHLLQHYLLLVCLAAAAAGRVLHQPAPRPARPCVPLRMAPAPVWQLPAYGRRTVLASSFPLLMVVGTPLSDGPPPAIDHGLSTAARFTPPAVAAGAPLRLAIAARLGAAAPPGPPAAAASGEPPLELAFERTLQRSPQLTRAGSDTIAR